MERKFYIQETDVYGKRQEREEVTENEFWNWLDRSGYEISVDQRVKEIRFIIRNDGKVTGENAVMVFQVEPENKTEGAKE